MASVQGTHWLPSKPASKHHRLFCSLYGRPARQATKQSAHLLQSLSPASGIKQLRLKVGPVSASLAMAVAATSPCTMPSAASPCSTQGASQRLQDGAGQGGAGTGRRRLLKIPGHVVLAGRTAAAAGRCCFGWPSFWQGLPIHPPPAPPTPALESSLHGGVLKDQVPVLPR